MSEDDWPMHTEAEIIADRHAPNWNGKRVCPLCKEITTYGRLTYCSVCEVNGCSLCQDSIGKRANAKFACKTHTQLEVQNIIVSLEKEEEERTRKAKEEDRAHREKLLARYIPEKELHKIICPFSLDNGSTLRVVCYYWQDDTRVFFKQKMSNRFYTVCSKRLDGTYRVLKRKLLRGDLRELLTPPYLYNGTEKQIKWATDIKQRFQALADQTDNTLLPDIPHAVFWIDNRDSSLEQLREAARKKGRSS